MVFFEILLSAQNAGFPRSSQLCYVYYKIYVSSTDYISGISVVLPERNVGDPQVVICSITSATVLDANSVTTSWTGPNGVITNDDRVTINTTVENNIYTSILHFDYIAESDEGIYSCNMTTIDHNVSLSTNTCKLCVMP